MKLIHLSDLHIGKRVNGLSMLEDQAYILEQALQIIDREAPEGVLIAGDVYDKTVPSAEAVVLFDDFLCRLAQRQVPALIISGNHDSPERLAFGGRLMEKEGVYMAPVYDGSLRSVTLFDRHGPVEVWLLPFLKPAHVRRFYPEAQVETYTDACRVALEKAGVDPSRRNVLLAHQFVAGAEVCESEELSVGGSDCVDAEVFRGFDYVALGHLHGPQNVGDHRIRYCGSPLKYSFSEERHRKSVTVVRLGEKGALTLELAPLTPRRELRTLRGTFRELTEENRDPGDREDYLHIVLTDEEDVPEAVSRLRPVYPNLMKLSYDNTRTRTDRAPEDPRLVHRKTPLELFEELYEQQNNQPMSPEQRQLTRELIEAIGEEEV